VIDPKVVWKAVCEVVFRMPDFCVSDIEAEIIRAFNAEYYRAYEEYPSGDSPSARVFNDIGDILDKYAGLGAIRAGLRSCHKMTYNSSIEPLNRPFQKVAAGQAYDPDKPPPLP